MTAATHRRRVRRGPAARVRGLVSGRALRTATAISAQFSQALAAFVLSALAARALGAGGLGVYAVLTGWIVLVTGLMTGVVGDSLTVLDRGDARIRAGLQWWALVITAATAIGSCAISWAVGAIPGRTAVAFGVAAGTWVFEDCVRRVLMATMRFWGVVVVDLSHLVTATVFLVVLRQSRPLTLADFMVALTVGQLVGIVVGVCLFPRSERWLARRVRPALRDVAAFGVWRGTQQAIRPATLSVMRILVAVAVSTAAYGRLEAARVYMSPALLTVQGVGAYLLAHYAARSRGGESIRRAIRRADVAAATLIVATLVLGVPAVLCVGWLGPIVTGASFKIAPLAVASWAVFAASVAAVMPYASLAAVRGRQARVVAYRLLDASISVAAVVVLVSFTNASTSLVPVALAAGSFCGAAFQRRLARGAELPAPAPAPSAEALPTQTRRATSAEIA